MRLEWQNSRPFPSSPEPLFQSEAKCKFLCSYRDSLSDSLGTPPPKNAKSPLLIDACRSKTTLLKIPINIFIFMQIKLIFTRKVCTLLRFKVSFFFFLTRTKPVIVIDYSEYSNWFSLATQPSRNDLLALVYFTLKTANAI